MLGAQKQRSLQDFITKTIIKVGLVPNPNCETKKQRTGTWHVKNNNPTRFYCKEE